MSENTAGWTSSPYVRAAMIGLMLLGVAYGSKLYYQELHKPDTRATEALEGKLEGWFEAFDQGAKSSKSLQGFYEALPEAPRWYPEALPCGQVFIPFGAPPADWAKVPTPQAWSKDKTGFQMSMRRNKEGITLLARRDGDCDGHYEVRSLRVGFAWSGGLTRAEITIENANE